jgi:spermidine/putrescine transport system substrate-binding protein
MKGRKALISAVLGLAIVAIAAIGVASAKGRGSTSPSAATGTVHLFAFEDTLDPHVINGFRKAYPNIKLVTGAFANSDEAVAKLRAGFQADVVELCVRDTPRMAKAKLLQPIDPSQVTAWNGLFPGLRDGFDVNGKPYAVAQEGGTAGLVYNPAKIPGGIKSYKQLFEDPALKGKATLEGDPYYALAVAALAMGYKNPYALSDSDLKKVTAYFIAHKGNFRSFYSGDSDFLSLFQNGEIIAGQGFPDYPISLAKDKVKAVYVTPTEGTLTWECGLGVGAHASNVPAAYALINYFDTPAVQAYYAKRYDYIEANKATLKLLPKALIKAVGLDNPQQLNKAIPTQIAPNYDKWLEAWRQIQAS